MSSLRWPDHLLSLDEWDQLPEDVSRRFELVDGVLQRSPKPTFAHQRAGLVLGSQLRAVLDGSRLQVAPDVDVVLAAAPALVRAPDLVVVHRHAATGARVTGGDVVLAVEIVSPGSARVDRVSKLAEYGEAGIANYWIVDIAAGVSLDVFRLDGPIYTLARSVHGGRVELAEPVALTIDLDELLLR